MRDSNKKKENETGLERIVRKFSFAGGLYGKFRPGRNEAPWASRSQVDELFSKQQPPVVITTKKRKVLEGACAEPILSKRQEREPKERPTKKGIMKTFHEDGTIPDDTWIWVFGSNLAGIHGAGAALVAYRQFGALRGHGFGLTGHAFAIPTKDRAIKPLSLVEIEGYVWKFVRWAREHPESKFFVTRVGCGLAGFEDKEIAPMFAKASSNCSFPNTWRAFLRGDKHAMQRG